MSDEQDLAVFVREHVRSVWALELLLVLKRDAERCWDAADLVRELRASTMLVNDNLQRFARAGVAVRDDTGCWRYRPAAPVIADLCEQLEAAYRERPVAIINLISAPRDPLRSLADAFKFRRGEGE
ncbi:hypothetical protein [Phenylobacterium soli]|uniref:Transcriptional regulator n=1 Tax=Phenylobacterium soli TaxID=2170551 RepID=A0A328AES6_9CAUL|nr:hypothetical protein [Phenylobacterium soli]RAK53149.1 hypothetical protein DJ017_00685 [Phenylobacterium soli]